MIEILDIQDAPDKPLDITPELALAAYNVLREYCRQCGDDCGDCGLCRLHVSCPVDGSPEMWPEI